MWQTCRSFDLILNKNKTRDKTRTKLIREGIIMELTILKLFGSLRV